MIPTLQYLAAEKVPSISKLSECQLHNLTEPCVSFMKDIEAMNKSCESGYSHFCTLLQELNPPL